MTREEYVELLERGSMEAFLKSREQQNRYLKLRDEAIRIKNMSQIQWEAFLQEDAGL